MGKEKRAFERTKKSIQRATNVALDAAYQARRANSSRRTRVRTYRGTMSRGSGGAPMKTHALALLVASMALLVTGGNGQTPAPDASGGSFVDVSSNANAEVEGRFGTQPSQRSGQSLVRPVPGYTPIRPRLCTARLHPETSTQRFLFRAPLTASVTRLHF